MKDEPVASCVKCGGGAKRLFSAGVGIIFKGSGFYVNDYKGKGCPASSSSKSDSAPSEACASCTGGACEA